jgi:SOS-response transcriptional repressor LexA
MREDHINDGDIVVFHPGITGGNGIYVVSIGNSLVVKRVDFTPQTVTLISANPTYKPRRFSGPELSGISISGRVVACYHRA